MDSIDTIIDKDNNLIVHTVKGVLSLDDVRLKVESLLDDANFVKGMDVIWDINKAEMTHVEIEDILGLIKFMMENVIRRGTGFKLAIVASTDLGFGLAKMFTGYGQVLPFAKNVFRTLDEGLAWINESAPEEVRLVSSYINATPVSREMPGKNQQGLAVAVP